MRLAMPDARIEPGVGAGGQYLIGGAATGLSSHGRDTNATSMAASGDRDTRIQIPQGIQKSYGKMKGQCITTRGAVFNLFLSFLYVDDGSFLFENKGDLTKRTSILYHHIKQFELLMHIGKNGSKSKRRPYAYRHRGKQQGYVTFNRRFTYLGSMITDDLKDSAEICSRIGKVNGSILHGLNNMWRSKGLYVSMKKQFYITTVVNIVLWGCESLTILTIRAANMKKLKVFPHKAMQHILNITK
jgi:hypothetical protein